jgi:hypothetical protein
MGEPNLRVPALINDTDSSVDFNGIDAGVVLPASLSLGPSTEITIEAWAQLDTVPTAPRSGWILFAKWETALLYVQGGELSRFVFALFDPRTMKHLPTAASKTSVTPGVTYHVVGTYDSSNLRLYVNGALEAATPRVGSVNDSPRGGAISPGGWGSLPSPRFDGRIDEVAIYGVGLSSTRVRAHYALGAEALN